MSELKKVATRAGFGEEILKLGKENPDILVIIFDIHGVDDIFFIQVFFQKNFVVLIESFNNLMSKFSVSSMVIQNQLIS